MKGTAHSPPPTANDATPVYRIFLHFPSLLTAGFLLLNRTLPELLIKQKQKNTFSFRLRIPVKSMTFLPVDQVPKLKKPNEGKKTNKLKPNKTLKQK